MPPPQRLTKKWRFQWVAVSALLAVVMLGCSWRIFQKYRALTALHASGFVTARCLPLPRWLRPNGEVWAIENTGWVGVHLTALCGPLPRHVNPQAIQAIIHLNQTQWLSAQHADLTDDQLALLTRVTSLKTLLIDGNPITDEGLAHLAPLTSLQVLNVSNTNVTSQGVERLRQALPHCRIIDHQTESTETIDPNGIH
ncbi:MAG: hypothetical protein SH850_15145 [Planctomycetaceae bacterium]|nr:hypothetical protein [Planctomycetaceae bacterium]